MVLTGACVLPLLIMEGAGVTQNSYPEENKSTEEMYYDIDIYWNSEIQFSVWGLHLPVRREVVRASE